VGYDIVSFGRLVPVFRRSLLSLSSGQWKWPFRHYYVMYELEKFMAVSFLYWS